MNNGRYQKTIDYLTKCAENDALSHAYIFYGPDENSKREAATRLTEKIFGKNSRVFNPDLMLMKPENGAFSIDSVRQIKKFLALRPYANNRKMVIIESAEALNNLNQNALLKVFEEAPEHTAIILFAKTLGSMSETIASRAVKLPFWFLRREMSEQPADGDYAKIFESLIRPGFSQKYRYIEKIDQQNIPEFFGLWINFLRNKLLADPTEKIAGILSKSQSIYFKLKETNINSKLAFDELLINLPD